MSNLVKLIRAAGKSNTNRFAVGLGGLFTLVANSEFLMDLLSKNPQALMWFGIAQSVFMIFQRTRKGHVNILDVVNKGLKNAVSVTVEAEDANTAA